MSRHKGRTSPAAIERDFPNIVEVFVPEGGLGKRIDAMYEFHALHNIKAMRGQSRRDDAGRDYIRFCFVDPSIAKDFAEAFEASD